MIENDRKLVIKFRIEFMASISNRLQSRDFHIRDFRTKKYFEEKDQGWIFSDSPTMVLAASNAPKSRFRLEWNDNEGTIAIYSLALGMRPMCFRCTRFGDNYYYRFIFKENGEVVNFQLITMASTGSSLVISLRGPGTKRLGIENEYFLTICRCNIPCECNRGDKEAKFELIS